MHKTGCCVGGFHQKMHIKFPEFANYICIEDIVLQLHIPADVSQQI